MDGETKGEAWLRYRFTEATMGILALFPLRFFRAERAFLRTPRLQRIKRKPCKHFRNARLYSRAIRKPFIVVAPFPRFFWGNEIFQFEICPWIDVCMCCVSLKWWLERGASIESERIGNAIYCGECLSICCNGNVVLQKWNLCEVSFWEEWKLKEGESWKKLS